MRDTARKYNILTAKESVKEGGAKSSRWPCEIAVKMKTENLPLDPATWKPMMILISTFYAIM